MVSQVLGPLLLADTEHHASRSLRMALHGADPAALQAALDALRNDGLARLARDGFPPERSVVEVSARARYVGQSSELPVTLKDADATTIIAAARRPSDLRSTPSTTNGHTR